MRKSITLSNEQLPPGVILIKVNIIACSLEPSSGESHSCDSPLPRCFWEQQGERMIL
jgi:hypothetical protein